MIRPESVNEHPEQFTIRFIKQANRGTLIGSQAVSQHPYGQL